MSLRRTLSVLALALALAHPVTAQEEAARDSAILGIERSIWNHIASKDWGGVQSLLGGVLSVDLRGVYDWGPGDTERLQTRLRWCSLDGFTIPDVRTRDVAQDVVVLGYRIDLVVNCGGLRLTRTNHYLSTYRRQDSGWQLVASAIVAPSGVPVQVTALIALTLLGFILLLTLLWRRAVRRARVAAA